MRRVKRFESGIVYNPITLTPDQTVADAKAILSGPQDSATQYLNKSSREQIRAKFLPIVKQATDQVGLAQQYNAVAAKVPAGLNGNYANIESYVTEQALDGLFEMIAKQEAGIRQNPAARILPERPSPPPRHCRLRPTPEADESRRAEPLPATIQFHPAGPRFNGVG